MQFPIVPPSCSGVSTRSQYKARFTSQGVVLTDRDDGSRIEVKRHPEGVTLQGGVFDHQLKVEGNQVSVLQLGNGEQEGKIQLEQAPSDTLRAALGVTASLVGVPVNLLLGKDPEKIYLHLSGRYDVLRRRGGTRRGGRYRVEGLTQWLNGDFEFQGTQGRRLFGSIRDEYPLRQTTNFHTASQHTNRSVWPISQTDAFARLSGATFPEQVHSGALSVWRQAGCPGTVGAALETADALLDSVYPFNSDYEIYQLAPEGGARLQQLAHSEPEAAWEVMKQIRRSK